MGCVRFLSGVSKFRLLGFSGHRAAEVVGEALGGLDVAEEAGQGFWRPSAL
jgi:hypothetical protein